MMVVLEGSSFDVADRPELCWAQGLLYVQFDVQDRPTHSGIADPAQRRLAAGAGAGVHPGPDGRVRILGFDAVRPMAQLDALADQTDMGGAARASVEQSRWLTGLRCERQAFPHR
jgi:hypothetical protein